MAVGESAGTVFVTIQGDATQLQALFAQTQGAAQAAGVRIATSFNAGAGSVSALETAIRELTTAVGQLNAALATNVSVTNAGAQAHRNFSSAAHGSVTEIQATSGALRVLEGSGGIRAAERFLTMIPGLGAALQMAFPVIGAIALIDATKKLIDNFSGLKEAEQGAEEAARAADSEFAHMVTTIDALNSKQQGAQFGGASAKFLNAQNLKSEAATATGALAGLQTQLAEYKKSTENIGNDFQAALTFGKSTQAEQANIQALTDKIAAAEQKVRVVVKQANDAYTDAVRDRAQEVGALSAKQVDGQIAGIKAEADAQREAAKAVIEQWKIAADSQAQSLTSAQARMVALSSNEVDAAERKADRLSAIAQDEAQREIEAINRKAAAQAQGKPETERREIFQGAANEVQGVQAGTLKTILDLHYALEAAILKEKETAVQAAREEEAEQKRFNEELEKTAEHWQKAGVEAVKAQTAHIEAQNKIGEKEGGPLSGTASTRLAGTPLGAALTLNQQGVKTVQILQDQIGRQQQLIDLANQVNIPIANRLAMEQQLLQLRISLATAQGQTDNADKIAAANVALQQTLTQWKSMGIGNAAQDIESAFAKAPAALGGALASGVTGGGKQGQDIGKQVGEALKGAGKQLLGEVFTQAIEKLIATIAVQTGLQAVFNTVFGTGTAAQVVATTANTVALVADTAATIGLTVAEYYAGTATLLGGFAEGTSSAPGGLSLVGEKGPELMNVPRGAQIIPNHKISKFADGVGFTNITHGRSGDIHIHGGVHAHGINNPAHFTDRVMKQISERAKTANPRSSPYSR